MDLVLNSDTIEYTVMEKIMSSYIISIAITVIAIEYVILIYLIQKTIKYQYTCFTSDVLYRLIKFLTGMK